MVAANLDTLPPELFSYICKLIYLSNRASLGSLTLANKKCESAASKYIFRDIGFSYRCLKEGQVRPDCETWEALLTHRECLESVRCLYVHGALRPQAPLRFLGRRRTVLRAKEWQEEDGSDDYDVHEQASMEREEDIFLALAQLIEKLFRLERLHWAAIEQVPNCVLATITKIRVDLRLEIPEWRLRCLEQGEISQNQITLITLPSLKSITAKIVQEDVNGGVLLRMLGGLSPTLEEVRIIKCETLTAYNVDTSEDIRRRMLQDICERSEQKAKARPTLFSIHGKSPVDMTELQQWFDAADMSSLQRLELRSGVCPAEVWNATMRVQSLPHLRELLLGFNSDCTSEEHEAAIEWFQNLYNFHHKTLQKLELRGNIAPKLVNIALKVHGKTLRKISLNPQAHSGFSTLRYSSSDLKNLNTLCPSLEKLSIPLERGRTIGSELHESQNYAAFGQFANLTHLHILLDCSRWGDMRPVEMLQGSQDEAFEEQTYISLDVRRITYRHVRYALINSAVDDVLAKSIWNLATAQKVGLPLHELYVQPYGNMEIIRGFRPDDRPELAGRFVDLYAMLRELSRSYKLTRHIRDDVNELVVREPPDTLPRGIWSKVDDELRELAEVVCHPNGAEMEIFRRIWPSRPGSLSWRDDWYSLDLPKPDGGHAR